MWALIGFLAATMTCLGIRILSDLPNKVRAFGARRSVELSVTAAALFALPPLVITHFKYPGAALAPMKYRWRDTGCRMLQGAP